MKITIIEKTVTRYHTQCNRELDGRINSITANPLSNYNSDIIPRCGDVICLDGKYYDITNVIHMMTKLWDRANDVPAFHETDVVLEVKPHSNKHIYNNGSDSFVEEIPLVTQVNEDLKL